MVLIAMKEFDVDSVSKPLHREVLGDEKQRKIFCVAKNPSHYKNLYLPAQFPENVLKHSEESVVVETFLKCENDAKVIRDHVGQVTNASFVTVSHKTSKKDNYKRILYKCIHGSEHRQQYKKYNKTYTR